MTHHSKIKVHFIEIQENEIKDKIAKLHRERGPIIGRRKGECYSCFMVSRLKVYCTFLSWYFSLLASVFDTAFHSSFLTAIFT